MYNILIITNIPVIGLALLNIANSVIPETINGHIYSFNDTGRLQGETKVEMLILDLSTTSSKTKEWVPILEKLKNGNPSLKMILVCPDAYNPLLTKTLKAGVIGIAGPGAGLGDLQDCIERVYGGDTYIGNGVIPDFKRRYKAKVPRNEKLSYREKTVAKLLVEGKNNTEISDLLQLRPSTIGTFKQQIFKKLKVKNLLELDTKLDKTGY